MHPVMQKFVERGIPIRSAVAAIQYLSDKQETMTPAHYQSLLEEFVGEQVHTKLTGVDADRQLKYTLLYFVQETIRKSFSTDKINPIEILGTASDKAKKFIVENPWTFATGESDVPKVDSNGNAKRKKGAKQEEAARIYIENKAKGKKTVIEMFMSELDMSKAGATTYFYNMKKQLGE